ncbi:MAG TPA: C45 family autoproteolytic acyltransferase/hydrolase [bacterium]|nr:C45 family autoproteolytic acyltransferase/hydrolase [bacterium]
MFFMELSGTGYEMGYQAGKLSRLAIGATIDLLAKGFRRWDNEQFTSARKKYMSFTEKICPELIEEIQGMADGSGFPFQWLYLANFYALMKESREGCSNIVFTQSGSGPMMAKTNDLPVHEGKHSIVKLKRPRNGYASLSVSWAGTVWGGAGINEAGLAVGGSSSSSSVQAPDNPIDPHCLNYCLLTRAGSVAEAVDLLKDIPLTARGANIPLADRSGDAVVVEKAGNLQYLRRPVDGVLWCTNHSLSGEMAPYRADNPARLNESMERYAAIENLIREKPRDAGLLKKIVAYNRRPGALCRYGDDDPLKYETEWAGIFHPSRQEIEVCFTHADRDPWVGFRM